MASIMGIKAGRAFVLIEAVDKTGKILNQVGNRFKMWSTEITKLGATMMMTAITSLFPVGLALDEFREFDDAMKKVEARSRGTAIEMMNIRKQARELGRTTAFTSGQVGELQAQLAQKGFTRAQLLAMSPGVVNMALAGGEKKNLAEDATNAAELVSGTLKAFQMDASEAGRVADVFTVAINNSNQKLDSLITGMSYASAIAHRYKLSLEDTVAILSQMRDLNIEASITGTAFRNMLVELSDFKKIGEFNEMLKEMAGTVIEFGDGAGNLRPLSTILFEIGDAIRGLGSQQQGALLQKIFGKRALVPASALAEGRNPFQNLKKLLDEAGGASQRTAALMESGIGGTWRRFLSAIGDLKIGIGESLGPGLVDLGEKFSHALDKMTVWISNNRQAVIQATLFTIGMGAMGASLMALGVTLRLTGVLFKVLGVGASGVAITLRLMTMPIFLLVRSLKLLRHITVLYTITLKSLQFLWFTTKAAALVLLGVTKLLYGSMVVLNAIYLATTASIGIFGTAMSTMITGVNAMNAGVAAASAGLGMFMALIQALAASPAFLAIAAGLSVFYFFGDDLFDALEGAIRSVTDAAKELGSDFVGVMIDLKNKSIEAGQTLRTAFRGVNEALELGDTQLAWEIGLNGLYLSFLQFTGDLLDAWNGFSATFTSSSSALGLSFADDWSNSTMTMAGAFRSILETWIGGVATLRNLWVDFVAEVLVAMTEIEIRGKRMIPMGEYSGAEGNEKAVADIAALKKMIALGATAAKAQNDKAGLKALETYDKGVEEARKERELDISVARMLLDEQLSAIEERKASERVAHEEKLRQHEEELEAAKKVAALKAANDLKIAELLNGPNLAGILPDPTKPGKERSESQAIEAIQGLEKGTIAAAEKAYENQQRGQMQAINLAERQLRELQRINENLDELAVMEGV
jgi:TP901 family phage tail tape measure protein